MPLRNAVAVETRAGSYRSAIGKIAVESTAGQRIVSMEADAIVAEAFEQFRFDRTRDRVVHSLVDAWPYPSMARGNFRCLRHLPRAEIADAELLEQAFVIKFLDGRQRRFDRRGAIRRHQIEDLDLIRLQARQGLLEDSLQVLRFEDFLQVLRLVAGSVSGMNPRGDAEPFGGAEITQHLFAGSIAIDRARVELVVAKFQDGAKHRVCGRSVMNPGSVSVVAERHGAEGDVSDGCFGHSKLLASLSMATR